MDIFKICGSHNPMRHFDPVKILFHFLFLILAVPQFGFATYIAGYNEALKEHCITYRYNHEGRENADGRYEDLKEPITDAEVTQFIYSSPELSSLTKQALFWTYKSPTLSSVRTILFNKNQICASEIHKILEHHLQSSLRSKAAKTLVFGGLLLWMNSTYNFIPAIMPGWATWAVSPTTTLLGNFSFSFITVLTMELSSEVTKWLFKLGETSDTLRTIDQENAKQWLKSQKTLTLNEEMGRNTYQLAFNSLNELLTAMMMDYGLKQNVNPSFLGSEDEKRFLIERLSFLIFLLRKQFPDVSPDSPLISQNMSMRLKTLRERFPAEMRDLIFARLKHSHSVLSLSFEASDEAYYKRIFDAWLPGLPEPLPLL